MNCGGAVCAGAERLRGLPRFFFVATSPTFTTTDCFETCETLPSELVLLTDDFFTTFLSFLSSVEDFLSFDLDLLRERCNGILYIYVRK